ncbi:hypothetical protein D3C71_1121800 [compost metagenome]
MGRRHHRRPGLPRARHAFRHHQAIRIHGHRHGVQEGLRQERSRGRIAGVFHPDTVAGRKQGLDDQLHREVVARGDIHLRGLAMNAARHAQIGRYRNAQVGQAIRRRIRQVGRLQAAQLAGAQARPELARKGIQGRYAHLERQDAGRPMPAVLVVSRFDGRDNRGRGGLRLQVRRDDGAGLPARLDVAFGGQQGIRHFDRAARHAHFLGQGARRRNAVAGFQGALGDGAAKALIDLAVQRVGAVRGKRCLGLGAAADHGIVQSSIYGSTNYGMANLR